MKRRSFVAKLGTATAGAGLVVSSGAFMSVQAERKVSVATAHDDSALLRLEPLADDGLNGDSTLRSVSDGTEVYFQIPGSGSGESSAKGVGLDSEYEFHDLLNIQNRGTQPVEIYSSYDGDALQNLALVRDAGILRSDPPTLTQGGDINVGLYIDTQESNLGKFDETLTITADPPDN
jgi:hypothetical protein